MGVFKQLFGRTPAQLPPELVGCWHLTQSDDPSIEPAEMDFRADGHLYYSVDAGDRWQIIKLVWRVEGAMIVSDQPSASRQERTPFAFDEAGLLVLEFRGHRSRFRRGPKRAPDV
ncbi:MAG TPA: hypothetical protein VGQ28_11780 [Thermoanaerobaculia bacterium]|jgi:hypothetical protein|nr:hypothetical protein [Thermoanaerobaculia bacterium]